jgi:hypothetical protein
MISFSPKGSVPKCTNCKVFSDELTYGIKVARCVHNTSSCIYILHTVQDSKSRIKIRYLYKLHNTKQTRWMHIFFFCYFPNPIASLCFPVPVAAAFIHKLSSYLYAVLRIRIRIRRSVCFWASRILIRIR